VKRKAAPLWKSEEKRNRLPDRQIEDEDEDETALSAPDRFQVRTIGT